MAKKITRKRVRRKDEYSVVVNGKEEFAKTSCKTFGMLNESTVQFGMDFETGNLIGKCKNCAKRNPDLVEKCMLKSDPQGWDWVEKQKTTKSDRKPRPFNLVVKQMKDGVTRKAICDGLINDGFKGSAKSFVSTIGCAINALDGKSRKKDGTMAVYCDWLKNGNKGIEPKGDQGSIWYCKKVWQSLNELELI